MSYKNLHKSERTNIKNISKPIIGRYIIINGKLKFIEKNGEIKKDVTK